MQAESWCEIGRWGCWTRLTGGTTEDLHASSVAIFVVSECRNQTNNTEWKIPPAPDANYYVSHQFQILQVGSGHLKTLCPLFAP